MIADKWVEIAAVYANRLVHCTPQYCGNSYKARDIVGNIGKAVDKTSLELHFSIENIMIAIYNYN